MLACVFGAEHFHTYIFGKKFTIESDHRPLEMISKKNLTAAPARLQRMLLQLQRYNYSINYRPGKEMVLADRLSRLHTCRNDKSEEIELSHKVCFIQFSTSRLQELRDVSKQDEELCLLARYITRGFPEKYRDIHQHV